MLNAFIRDVRLTIDEEAVPDGTSTDGAGYERRTLDGGEILDDSSHLGGVGRGALATGNVLHDDIAKAAVLESKINLGNSHLDIRVGVDDSRNVSLGAGLAHGHVIAVFDPSNGHALRFISDDKTRVLIAGGFAQFHDAVRLGQGDRHVFGENDRLDNGLDGVLVGHDEHISTVIDEFTRNSDNTMETTNNEYVICRPGFKAGSPDV